MSKPEYKVVLTAVSYGDSEEIHVDLEWLPTLTADEIVEQGYIPASYIFSQDLVALVAESAAGDSLEVEEADPDRVVH